MNPTPESQSTRPQLHQRHSIASVSTIRADPFVDDRYRHPYNGQNAVGLFPGSASGSQAPPIPPARSSSLRGIPEPDFISNPPGSPLTRHVPSVQVIHPTPTKKKSRPRSTASGDTATAGSPLQRAASRASELDLEDTGGDPDKEEAKRARAREKGRERQRRKRERDKVKSGKPERVSHVHSRKFVEQWLTDRNLHTDGLAQTLPSQILLRSRPLSPRPTQPSLTRILCTPYPYHPTRLSQYLPPHPRCQANHLPTMLFLLGSPQTPFGRAKLDARQLLLLLPPTWSLVVRHQSAANPKQNRKIFDTVWVSPCRSVPRVYCRATPKVMRPSVKDQGPDGRSLHSRRRRA